VRPVFDADGTRTGAIVARRKRAGRGSIVGLIVCASAAAWGQDSGGDRPSLCPTPAAVARAARPLLDPHGNVQDGADVKVDVRDFGTHYTVAVNGRMRDYTDESRDCAARARAAAVFVALTLAPSSDESTTQPPPRQPEPPRPATTPPDADGWATQLELGALAAAAPRSHGTQGVAGGELHVAVTAGHWGVALGGSLPTASDFDLAAVRVRQSRVPFDLGARRVWSNNWVQGTLDVGLLAALCQLKLAESPSTQTMTRVDLGVRAAATLATRSPHVGLYARLFSELMPVTQPLAVQPQGIIGHTSPIWVGAAIGVVATFR
jgi:hypothetical protein